MHHIPAGRKTSWANKCCWVIEDFHNLRDKEKVKLAQVLKIFMDTFFESPRLIIIVVGEVDSAPEATNQDADMNNRVAEIEVRLMGSKKTGVFIRLCNKYFF